MKSIAPAVFLLCALASAAFAGNVFVEAESFESDGGWVVIGGNSAKRASGLAMLSGAQGQSTGIASTIVKIKDAGSYHVWVRYASHPTDRGTFHLGAFAEGAELGGALFDAQFEGRSAREPEVWKSFDVVLPEGEVTLRLSKHETANSNVSAPLVDCVLLTMDDDLAPNHLHYGAQTFVRVTLGEGYESPVYLHVFADHYHAPWYQHYSLARDGVTPRTAPPKSELMNDNQRTPWCNITPMLYQDSGARLRISARRSYTKPADRLRAVFEFATAADEKAIVRTLRIDNCPGSLSLCVPPNLLTSENLAHLKTDREIADEIGKLADDHLWPTHGRPLEKFPFFVSSHLEKSPDASVRERESKTLGYFGFSDEHFRHVPGAWYRLQDSYCRPDLAKMKARAAEQAAEFEQAGGDVKKILFAALTDEPKGQSLEFMARDSAYGSEFRAWLKRLGKTPADLLVADWDDVKPVTLADGDKFPALYYFSQRFRTRALGDFMAMQREILEAAYGGTLRTVANFSDGAVYNANFYTQGVDYFELLDDPRNNAIWGEDWANGASTSQCASFNVDLMRAAAREHGQTIGHHLIAYANRKPWDVKLKATSEMARGVKILNNFCYGPSWATHEGGPYWRSTLWYAKPATWTANAALTREVGAVEDMLLSAMPAAAETALLYSSASDAWAVGGNQAYGFDRMHTWLALAHEQVPVDVLHESQIEAGRLDGYKVCYVSGPNLTRAAATKLKAWVREGGVLWLTAACRDEYNRPLAELDEALPVERGECLELQPHRASGKYLRLLTAQDHVHWGSALAEVLSVKQRLTARDGAEILATFDDASPALLRHPYGKGHVYCAGFLPGLAYVKAALQARFTLEERAQRDRLSLGAQDAELLERSANPWEFPADIRRLIRLPVMEHGVTRPIECSAPLVDAVFMSHEHGILIPLANYTNRALADFEMTVNVARPVARVESAVHGPLPFTRLSPKRIRVSLPLDNNDFVKLYFEPTVLQ